MSKIDFDAFQRHLELVGSDPALLDQFRTNHRWLFDWCAGHQALVTEKKLEPLPPLSDIAAIQIALFDNWAATGKRTKNHPNRYGMALELWTCADRVGTKRVDRKANMRLMSAKELLKRAPALIRSKLKYPISQAYADTLISAATQNPDVLFGMIATITPSDGTIYHDHQFVILDMRSKHRCYVQLGEDAFAMPAFSDVHANGSPLADSVLGQSRFDNIGLLDGWRT